MFGKLKSLFSRKKKKPLTDQFVERTKAQEVRAKSIQTNRQVGVGKKQSWKEDEVDASAIDIDMVFFTPPDSYKTVVTPSLTGSSHSQRYESKTQVEDSPSVYQSYSSNRSSDCDSDSSSKSYSSFSSCSSSYDSSSSSSCDSSSSSSCD